MTPAALVLCHQRSSASSASPSIWTMPHRSSKHCCRTRITSTPGYPSKFFMEKLHLWLHTELCDVRTDAVESDMVIGQMLSGVHTDISSWALCLSRRLHALWAVLLSRPQQPRCLSPRQPIWLIRKSIFRSFLNGWNAYSCALLHHVAFVHKHVDIRGGALLSVGVGEVLAEGQLRPHGTQQWSQNRIDPPPNLQKAAAVSLLAQL